MGVNSNSTLLSVWSSSRFKFLAFLVLLLVFHQSAIAQDPKKQYKNARDFFQEGKYNLAMEAFKPLLAYDKNNPYSEYASFYYALSAFRQNYFAVAKDMFLQIRKLYPAWDQLNEVNYWLAKIYFDQHEYFQGMHVLKDVKQEDYIESQEIAKVKKFYLAQITDPEIMRLMWEEYPDDEEVGKALARAISLQPSMSQDKGLQDLVIKKFNLSPELYVTPDLMPAVFRDHYNVAVLFPFLASTLDPSPGKKQNQVMLDLYEGMRMANDTLKKMGININLNAYDTEGSPNDAGRGQETLKKLLESEELRNTDLIVGPLFRNETRTAREFSEKFQTNIIHPVSNYSEFVAQNPYAMLYQPSLETLGSRSAELLAGRLKNKNCMIIYGDSPRDSVMAANFSVKAKDIGLNVVWAEEFRRETAARIITILATPTEFDELKNPIQFSLKLDSIGSIFVASNDPLIYTKVISSVETRGDSVLIVGSESWLDNTSVDLTKYERLHVMFAAPNYSPLNKPAYIDFRKRFIKTHGYFPPEYLNNSKLGYEFMLFIGNAMKKYGVYFQDGLSKESSVFPGLLSSGYHLSPQHDNDHVPFIYFKSGELLLLE